MECSLFERLDGHAWRIAPHGAMRVPGLVFASESLLRAMDYKVYQQVCNVAALPGIVEASFAMPDAHWGYGFPIGGVAAFDADAGGVVSAGGVGFDISCGVRTLTTGLTREDVYPLREHLADALYRAVPAGLGSEGEIALDVHAMDRMLEGGACWAVQQGYGDAADLTRIEEGGCVAGARPAEVSERAKQRQQREMGTLGSGNHYLELQVVDAVFNETAARTFGLATGEVVVSIHCGSRGLGHQIGSDYLKRMLEAAPRHGISLPDRELACVPLRSALGEAYLGAMRAGINCALANRQIVTHLARGAFREVLPRARLALLYDVSHNTCKLETHTVAGRPRELFVHRKGATRARGPGHPSLPAAFREVGQPVLIGGSMGTCSWVLAGNERGESRSFASACHGAGRGMSRHAAGKRWKGHEVVAELAARGIVVRSPSLRGVAEEAPGAYKDVSEVVEAAHAAGLARKVARLLPMACVKG